MEKNVCPICGSQFDTGKILLDKRLQNKFEMKTLTGFSPCKECTKKLDEGYVAFIEVDPERSEQKDGLIKPQDAFRTGNAGWIRKTIANQLFNVEVDTMFFIDPQAFKQLVSQIPNQNSN